MSVDNSKIDKEPFLVVKDTNDGSIKRIATTSDLQVGTTQNPAELSLTGRISFANRTVTLNKIEKIYINNLDTAVTVDELPATFFGNVEVILPSNPRMGQVHIVKDGAGFTSIHNLILSANNSTIDGSSTQTIDTNYGSLLVIWMGDEWKRLVTAGAAGSAPINAKYVTLSTNSTLTDERVLAVSSGHLVLTDGGAGNSVTLSLDATAVVSGSYTAADITVDMYGRITAASNGSAAPIDASYVVISNDATLTDERVLSVLATDIVLVDSGAGNAAILSLATVVGVTGSYTTPATIDIDTKGRVTAITSLAYVPANLNAAYVTIGGDGTLTNDRALSDNPGITITDLGANNFVKIGIDDNVVATISGSTYTGRVTASPQYGFTGSLTRLVSGIPLVTGSSNSFISANIHNTINGTYFGISSSKVFDNHAPYVVISTTSSLENERYLAAGVGISLTDNGPGNSFEIAYTGAVVQPADKDATYLVLTATSSLPNERAIVIGEGLSYTDSGPGGNYLVRINNNAIATLTGSAYSGRISLLSTSDIIAARNKGITGSITKIWTGNNYFSNVYPFGITLEDPPASELIPYIVGVGSVTVSTGAYGQISISASGLGADDAASYVLLSTTASLANERVLTQGLGITITDNGPGGTVVIAANTGVYDDLYASKQAQYIVVSNTASLPNERMLTGGTNIQIVDNGAGSSIIINNVGTADADANYVLYDSATGSLPNGKLLIGGGRVGKDTAGVIPEPIAFAITDKTGWESNGKYVKFYDKVLATISGSTFTGPISASHIYGITGSLTRLSTGQEYLKAGAGIELTTSSLGQVTITSLTGNPGADQAATFILVQPTGSIVNARIIASSSGIRITDAGPSDLLTIGIDNSVIATISGSTFTGPVVVASSQHGFTGSLTKLVNDQSYIAAGQNVTVVSSSAGQITISSPTWADHAASYVVLNSTASLPNERVLTGGTNISVQDNGPGGTLVINSLVGPTTGASVPQFVMPLLAGNAITTVADETSKQTVGMLYFRPGIITSFSGTSNFYFRNIIQTSSTGSWVAMDLYDVNGIVTGIPSVISGSIMSSSSDNVTWKSNTIQILLTVTGSGMIESRMWRISGSISQCFSSTIEVEFS